MGSDYMFGLEKNLVSGQEPRGVNENKVAAYALVLLPFFLFLSVYAQASCCTAVVNNGNWSFASTWSCGHAPANGDTIIIPANYTVNVNIVSPVYSNMTIWVYGHLYFISGQKIRLDCNSSLQVFVGGSLESASVGSKIEWCGSYAWNGPGPDPGPIMIPNSGLPITLVEFTAAGSEEFVHLNWITATETGNDFFTVERSRDGISFETVVIMDSKAPGGNSAQPLHYITSDEMPYEGMSYYRLKQTDINGKFTYSFLVPVAFRSAADWSFKVMPDPVKDGQVSLQFSSAVNETSMVIRVTDLCGKEKCFFIADLSSSRKIMFSLAPGFPGGMYLLTAVSPLHRFTGKLLVE